MQKLIISILLNLMLIGFSFAETESSFPEIPLQLDDSEQDNLRQSFFQRMKQAAEQGNAEAQYNLSVMYHEGEGVGQDEEKAVYWLKKSAAQGYIQAQDVLRTIE